MLHIDQPGAGECAPYYLTYVNATARDLADVNGGVQELLAKQPDQLEALLANIDPEIGRYAYAPGKWTLTESILHMCDTERVFAYRLLRIARGDTIALPGFDQDAWVPESGAAHRALASVVSEFRAVRQATLPLIEALDDVALARKGTASEQPVTVRALVWIIAGHAAHHVRITAERYLAPPAGR